jgi:hypothetical protein
MALNWSIAEVEDWKELAEDDTQRVVTDAIVWHALGIDIGEITPSNWPEVYARINYREKLHGAMCSQGGEPYFITKEDVKRRIGLSTNVITLGRAAWAMKLLDGEMRHSLDDEAEKPDPWRALRLELQSFDTDRIWQHFDKLRGTEEEPRLRDLVDRLDTALYHLTRMVEDKAWGLDREDQD